MQENMDEMTIEELKKLYYIEQIKNARESSTAMQTVVGLLSVFISKE